MRLLTPKQLEVLMVIAKKNPDGSDVDLDELLERIPYETTKASMQFTIRAMVEGGCITKTGRAARRGRKRTTLQATAEGAAAVGFSVVAPRDVAELEAEIMGTEI